MKIPRAANSELLHLALLRAAALLVPRTQRAEWFAEWSSELWYVHRSRGPATRFTLGAFHDALCLVNDAVAASWHRRFRWDSPLHCLLFLAVLGVVSWFCAFHSSVARDMKLTSPYRDPAGLVTISAHQHTGKLVPSISIPLFEKWAQTTHNRFSAIAMYQPVLAPIEIGAGRTLDLSVARASRNLFDMLGEPISHATPAASNMAGTLVILSRNAWRKHFASNPRITGRSIEVDGRTATIAGVVDEVALSGLFKKVDAWLLEDPSAFSNLADDPKGYVIARLAVTTPHPSSGLWHISLPGEDGSSREFDCVFLTEQVHSPLFVLLVFLVATWLVLHAGTPLSATGGMFGTLRQWTFLFAKVILLLPVAILGGLDLAHLAHLLTGLHLEVLFLLSGWFLGMRWAMRDQMTRCPVCLRPLMNPVAIGQASQTLLGWYGTEFFCSKGHGMLHLPELRTSSCSEPQWVRLDPSWSSLFT